MTRPRVVLVDDDASIRRLVTLTLEDLEVELVCCASAPEALEALRAAPARLVITDLMMPGVSGFDLLQQLVEQPALRGQARLAVFSAGLGAEVQKRLAGLPVWRQITKPVSVVALLEAVEEALAGGEAPAGPTADATAAPGGEAAAIAEFFAGDAALFHAFRDGCRLQFRSDLAQAEAAVAAGDTSALRHLAHSLKSVLLTLGEPAASAAARALEQAMAQGDWPAAAEPWGRLRAHLRQQVE